MKVLFWSIPNVASLAPGSVSDYQSDMLFHGMRNLLGADCIDLQRFWWMYKDDKEARPEDFKKIWGKGFTMYGLLDNIEVNREFTLGSEDKIILPVHHTIAQRPEIIVPLLKNALGIAEGKQIAIIDGWDQPYIAQDLLALCRANGIKYFKRELTNDINGVWPITFAFPAEKISNGAYCINDDDYKDIAPLVPVNQSIDPSYMSTYKYDNEEDYYKMYRSSYFALTSKKGGWDTLRHYEIIANDCVPLFVDIDVCPKNCLWNFPKDLCKRALDLPQLKLHLKNGEWERGMHLPHCGVIERDNPGHIDWPLTSEYYEIQKEFKTILKEQLTTEHLARYILETMDE